MCGELRLLYEGMFETEVEEDRLPAAVIGDWKCESGNDLQFAGKSYDQRMPGLTVVCESWPLRSDVRDQSVSTSTLKR